MAPLRSASLVLSRRALALPLLGGAAVACAPEAALPASAPAAPPPRLKAPLTYVALGASDAAGVGVDNPARDNWVAVLGRQLPPPSKVVNLGIPGIRLHEALDVELPPALDARPDLITVWLVVNDVLSAVPLERYQDGLDRLLGALRAASGAPIAVGNVPNAPAQSTYLGVPPAIRPGLTATWNEAIARSVAAHDATLVDLYRRWPVIDHPEYIGPDGLHPTVTGYRTLAETFRQVLREQGIV